MIDSVVTFGLCYGDVGMIRGSKKDVTSHTWELSMYVCIILFLQLEFENVLGLFSACYLDFSCVIC